MSVDPNWTRWAFASVATLFKQIAKDAPIAALVEGLDERTRDFMEAASRVEIRISGPFTRDVSKDYYEFGVDLNLLFTSRYEVNGNQYDILKIVGLFHAAMDDPIPILRLGDEPGDDESLVGCLLLRTERNDALRVFHFGQQDQTDRQKQVMIDGRYVAYLDT
jgi:hypothetical protein